MNFFSRLHSLVIVCAHWDEMREGFFNQTENLPKPITTSFGKRWQTVSLEDCSLKKRK